MGKKKHELRQLTPLEQQMMVQMKAQGPMYEMMANAFVRLGGEELVYDWGEENPGGIIRMMFTTCVPSLQPQSAIQGEVTLNVHHSLAPTALDNVVSEQ
jgi:hypothetical protein